MKTFPDGRVLYDDSAELQAACDYWLERLDLLEWSVTASICRATEFSQGERTGEVLYERAKQRAILRVLDPADYVGAAFPLDHEKTLLHELFHLRWSWLDNHVPERGSFTYRVWDEELELAVDKSARAVLTIFRKAYRPPCPYVIVDPPLPSVPATVVH